MFSRGDATYDIRPGLVDEISRSEASPLNRIARLIPDGAKVLDIGAGNGLLAAVLRTQHPSLVIDGIEPSPYAAELAKRHYRNLYCGYAQDFYHLIRDEQYDYLVFADVIEHIPDPYHFLKDLVGNLPPRTKLVLSVPNVAFGAIRIALLYGRFEYVDSGLLEKTHLRFFTRATLERLADGLGLHLEKMYFLTQNIFETETKLEKIGFDWCVYRKVLADELSSVYQYLLVLSPEATAVEIRSFGKRTSFPALRYFYRKYWKR